MRKIGIMSLGELVPEPSVTGPAAEAAAGLATHAMDVANFLKALGHDGRLMILCHLLSGPKSVTELETLLSSRQAAVSQQLARLRLEGLVSAERAGQAIFYSIRDQRVADILRFLAGVWCRDTEK